MKRFLAFVLIAALGLLTIGCESQTGTTENKTQTTTTQTKDGKTTGEVATTIDTKTTTTPATPGGGGTTTKKTTETTTEAQVVLAMFWPNSLLMQVEEECPMRVLMTSFAILLALVAFSPTRPMARIPAEAKAEVVWAAGSGDRRR